MSSTDNNIEFVELSVANQQTSNSRKKRDSVSDTESLINVHKIRKTFSLSISKSTAAGVAFCIYVCISVIIGISVVIFTAPKPQGKTCRFVLKSEALSSISIDSHPHSVVIKDLNNDSFLDIVVPNSGTNCIGVFLRDGNDTYRDQMTLSTGIYSIPYAVAVADFNRDQRLDLAVANFGTNNVGIFLGIANGTFSSQTMFSIGSFRPRYVAADDLNNDTNIDIAVVNHGTNDIGILLGDGMGNFSNWTTFFTGFDSLPYSLAIVDVNHDDRLDIIVANYGTGNVGLLLGHGNGSFKSQMTFDIGHRFQPYSVTVADLNNDTHIDIVAVSPNTDKIAVLLGSGTGPFSLSREYSTGENSSPRSVVVGYFDYDTEVDLAVATYGTSSVTLFLGRKSGIFSDGMTFYTTSDSQPYAMASGNFNNDTRLDLAIVNYDYNYVDIVLTYENYSFLNQTTYQTTGIKSNMMPIVVADLNNDRRLDIIVISDTANQINVFFGFNNGTFSTPNSYSTGKNSKPYSIAIGDFNNDSRLDIVVANNQNGTVGVFLAYDNGRWLNQTTYPADSGVYAVDVGDLNNDNRLDIVVVCKDTGSILILFGDGNGQFSNRRSYKVDSTAEPVWVRVYDFNNDKRLDIAVVNQIAGTVGIFFGYLNNTFMYQTVFSVGTGAGPNGAAIGDLNGDGRMDMVVNVYYNRAFEVLLGQDNGTLVNKTRYSVGSLARPSSSTIVDWNNDKRLDIIVTSCDTDNFFVFLGYGDGTFQTGIPYSTGSNSCPSSSGAGDLNVDGILDIVTGNANSGTIGISFGFAYRNGIRRATYATGSAAHPRAIALDHLTNNDTQLDIVLANYGWGTIGLLDGHPNGSFPSQKMFSTGDLSFPTSIAIDDVNKDHRRDIIVANSALGNVGILYGYGNGSFADQKIYFTGRYSSPQSVITGDFNNDTRVDIAVVYQGSGSVSTILKYDAVVFTKQNDYYTGSQSYPHAVALGDFNNDGCSDFVTVNRGSESISIFLGLSNGTFTGPTTYRAGRPTPSPLYAVVVGYLNNDSYLDIIISHYSINAISVFLGFGNGTFWKSGIYYIFLDALGNITLSGSQIYGGRPSLGLVGLAVGDFNEDHRLDLVVTFSSASRIGVFLGKNDSTFDKLVLCSTGTATDSIYVAVADFNNDTHLDIVVTNFQSSNIIVFGGNGNGSFFQMGNYSTGTKSAPRPIVAVDLDRDGHIDIVVGNSGSDNICVFFGYSNSSFSQPMFYPIDNGSLTYGLVVKDFDNNGQLDIAVASYGANNIAILFGLANRTFFYPRTYSTGEYSQPSFLAAADFNNDSRLDMVVASSGINSASVFFGSVIEEFLMGPAYTIESASQLTSIAIGDLDQDMHSDIVVADNGTNNIILVFGSAYGAFTRHITYSTGNNSHPCSVAVADLNNDYHLDIVVANSGTDSIGIFLADGSGTFRSQMLYSTGIRSQPYSVAVGDFDNDTRLDIAVANYGASNVGIFLGRGNGSFADQIVFNTGFGSHPFALTVGDVNNDNLTDVVAANNGYGNIDIISKIC